MTTVVIRVDEHNVDYRLAKLQMALSTWGGLIPWMKEVVEPYIQARARARFQNEGDDVSGAWAALQQSTIDIRQSGQVDYGAGPINVRTGELEQYITENSSNFLEIDGAAHMMYPAAGSTGGNAELLAKLQTAQQGLRTTPLPNGGVGGPTPARPVIGLNERDAATILTELELYIVAVAG